MLTLDKILDVDLLGKRVSEGLVTARKHESLPFTVLNYSKSCAWERAWDEVTTQTRGLIYNHETMEVLARPFQKFFNWNEGDYLIPSGPMISMPKFDGSLGILYDTDDGYAISTRGSFHSEQAAWATKAFHEIRGAGEEYAIFDPLKGKTYLFEIIYPENRIVVDYDGLETLFLIDVIDNETGFPDLAEFIRCNWVDKADRTISPGFDVSLLDGVPEDQEGLVLLWPAENFRTKMKKEHYIELHRLISNLSEKSVWEGLCAGKSINTMKKEMPEEFHTFIENAADDILTNVAEIVGEVIGAWMSVRHIESRKDFAYAIKDYPRKNYLFNLFDKKRIFRLALIDSKPKKVSDLTNEN